LFFWVSGHRCPNKLCCIAAAGVVPLVLLAWGDGLAMHVVDISFALMLATIHLLLFRCKLACFGNFWRHLDFFFTKDQVLVHLALVNLVNVGSTFVGLFLKSQLDLFLVVAEQFLH